MSRLVEVKIGRKILKFLDNRKPLFKLNSEMQNAVNENYALKVRKAISKQKKKIKDEETVKLINYKEKDKEKILKNNKKNAVTKYLHKLEDESMQLQQKYENKFVEKSFCNDYLPQEQDFVSG